MTSTKLIIYDLDGTLVDSAHTVTQILNEMRCERGLPVLQKHELVPWLSIGGAALVANALRIEVSNSQNELQEFRVRYSKCHTAMDTVYPEVFDVIKSLKTLGSLVAVCTNKPRILAEKVLFETGLFTHIDFLNAGGDLPNPKPHPQNLLSCLEHLQSTSELAIMVGDSSVDQQMAMATGVRFIQYAPGYDDGIVLAKNHSKINRHLNLLDFV